MTTRDFVISRRGALKLGLGATAAVALTATGCGSGGGAGGAKNADGKVELRLTWWGNDTRNANTAKLVEAYQKANPNVVIKPESGEWASYWDKLATQVAANDAPDIIQMDEKYIREYGGRGALLDLAKNGLDTSKFAPGTVKPGESKDGLMGINAGVNAPVILANPKVFKAAGVDLPDDKTWTWDDFKRIAVEITRKSPKGTYGSTSPMANDATLSGFLRQRGKALFTEDSLGFEAADAQAFYDWIMELQKAKAIPSPDEVAEDDGKSLDQSSFAIGKAGFGWVWSNQLNAYDAASGEDIKILRYPSQTGKAADAKLWYKASMFWSASSRTKNAEEVVKFINWLSNSVDAGAIQTTERGVPPNLDVREKIADKLTKSDKKTIAFIEAIEPELGDTPLPPPVGAGNFPDIQKRYGQDVIFGRSSSADAAKKLIDEVKGNISSAS
ncbi:extracellular solute-binding protein [Microlunatus panaciterrae]|uniref:Multiple sugar transport system substrate-binding protein n=1 Tax=Microlunatus panaciterrae TaxID=400768 RepID=A0ABS2RJR7_9ACTN|nr:extracellular solute-binding protein [Microlunatus panaciterrae]MBM7798436.1 multiple sugar transport system substrate-binding protein [Microlunatus panaciterrae]